jgi:response regulator RpfG family c-di-GMP phosphodiesterase
MNDMTDKMNTGNAPTMLCVDDEPNILSALRRLFRPLGYRILTAESGAAGLALLETESVDLVISDMRMPEMDGAAFLEQVRRLRPECVRMLLTGYSDITSILAAINRGEIYRYITKPWDDNDIVLVVRHALERRALERERDELVALTRRQNEQLRDLNTGLEAQVATRTAELKASNVATLAANDKLKKNFITTIKILSSMIEMRGGNLSGHARRVAETARDVAVKMGVPTKDAQDVFLAALLHDIGKIGFSDTLLAMPLSAMNGELLGIFRKHPVRAEQLLMPLEDLRPVAAILRAHMERFDGGGYPDGLSGTAIPLGARILALASDYDNLQIGALVQRKLPPDEARKIILDSSGKRYDPAVANAFRALLEGDEAQAPEDRAVTTKQLQAGMVLSRDLFSGEGQMLLSADHVLEERLIRQLQDFESQSKVRLMIWVWPKKVT